jgi:hypothetical protein
MPGTDFHVDPVILLGWLGAAAFLAILWLIHLRTRDAGISDFGWAASLGGLAVFYALALDGGWPPRRALVAGLAALWSLRLSWYLLVDRVLPPGSPMARLGTLRPVRVRDGNARIALWRPVFHQGRTPLIVRCPRGDGRSSRYLLRLPFGAPRRDPGGR